MKKVLGVLAILICAGVIFLPQRTYAFSFSDLQSFFSSFVGKITPFGVAPPGGSGGGGGGGGGSGCPGGQSNPHLTCGAGACIVVSTCGQTDSLCSGKTAGASCGNPPPPPIGACGQTQCWSCQGNRCVSDFNGRHKNSWCDNSCAGPVKGGNPGNPPPGSPPSNPGGSSGCPSPDKCFSGSCPASYIPDTKFSCSLAHGICCAPVCKLLHSSTSNVCASAYDCSNLGGTPNAGYTDCTGATDMCCTFKPANPHPRCGDGVCNTDVGETCVSCPQDCHTCNAPPTCAPKSYNECKSPNSPFDCGAGIPAGHVMHVTQDTNCVYSCTDTGQTCTPPPGGKAFPGRCNVGECVQNGACPTNGHNFGQLTCSPNFVCCNTATIPVTVKLPSGNQPGTGGPGQSTNSCNQCADANGTCSNGQTTSTDTSCNSQKCCSTKPGFGQGGIGTPCTLSGPHGIVSGTCQPPPPPLQSNNSCGTPLNASSCQSNLNCCAAPSPIKSCNGTGANKRQCQPWQDCVKDSQKGDYCLDKYCLNPNNYGNTVNNTYVGHCEGSGSSCQGAMPVLFNWCNSGSTICCPGPAPVPSVLGAQTQRAVTALQAKLYLRSVSDGQIYSATDYLVYDAASDTYTNQYFRLPNMLLGNYQIILHIDGYLDRFLRQSDGNYSYQIDSPTKSSSIAIDMIGGDINKDNFIDILDYNLMISCIQQGSACAYKDIADFEKDGIADQVDLDILMSHFGQLGDGFESAQFNCVTDPSCQSGTNNLQMCSLICTKTPESYR